jgi:hypothetical protein
MPTLTANGGERFGLLQFLYPNLEVCVRRDCASFKWNIFGESDALKTASDSSAHADRPSTISSTAPAATQMVGTRPAVIRPESRHAGEKPVRVVDQCLALPPEAL